ncbi:MAG: hypothetical protein FJW20_03095 [Acidimicrobiia bacterium]|nr:hypothetical protein [Acidimicrobiia bacterium]
MALDLARQLVLRWPEPDAAHVSLLRQADVEAVVLDAPHAGFEKACAAAGIVCTAGLTLPSGGLWPGLRNAGVRGRGADDTASASREPWIDSNLHLYGMRRLLRPSQPALLAYRAPASQMVPHETVELALAEARLSGGNCVLSLPARYREQLLAGEEKAVEAWQSLGRAARWLKENAVLCGRPAMPSIMVLVEQGGGTVEIAHLLYRRHASPMLAAVVPRPDPQRLLALVAAGLKPPAAALRREIFAHAEAGSTVVMDWAHGLSQKPVKQDTDRDWFSLGKGNVVGYREPVIDPSEFALDVIDIVTHRRRPVRLWNALSCIGLASEGQLTVINYGSAAQQEIQARIQGHYYSATLLRPEAPPVELNTARRGSTTEVFLPGIGRFAAVRFRGRA